MEKKGKYDKTTERELMLQLRKVADALRELKKDLPRAIKQRDEAEKKREKRSPWADAW